MIGAADHCYGHRVDFRGLAVPRYATLLALADEILREVPAQICPLR